jgi:hypothetical protein
MRRSAAIVATVLYNANPACYFIGIGLAVLKPLTGASEDDNILPEGVPLPERGQHS